MHFWHFLQRLPVSCLSYYVLLLDVFTNHQVILKACYASVLHVTRTYIFLPLGEGLLILSDNMMRQVTSGSGNYNEIKGTMLG